MKHTFQADIQELLNLIVHSFYSSKDIFLRELISNATDAIHKRKHFDLQNGKVNENYHIRISLNENDKILTIQDNGIGMNSEDLENNLSTIAKSGTKEFLKNVQESKEQIGRFGVGFYSVYLVAKNVQILTRKEGSPLFEWTSDGTKSYDIQECSDNSLLDSVGTIINISLKDDAYEYSNLEKIKSIVKYHSNWVDYPIELYTFTEKEISIEEEEEHIEDENEEEEGRVVENEKTEKVKEWFWEKINETTPIWMKNSKDVTTDEYNQFYKNCFKEHTDALFSHHFHTESGNWDCHGIFFIPDVNPMQFFSERSKEKRNIKLYVRKVLILDQLDKDMLPDWMSFVNGVVDCPDLPLNVSREMLQKSSTLRTLKNQIQKQVRNMLTSLKENEEKYNKFYEIHGKNIKLGIHEGDEKLLDYLKIHFDGKLSTLEDYVSQMKEGQDKIYYMTGENDYSFNSMFKSYQQNGYNVVLFKEPLDEFMMQRVSKYKEFEFVNISKEHTVPWNSETNLENVEEEEKFCKWVQEKLGVTNIESIKKSKSLVMESDDVGYIFSSKFGWTGNMEKLMAAQPLGDNKQQSFMKGKRIFELNFKHPLISRIYELYNSHYKNSEVENLDESIPKEENVVEVLKTIYNFTLLSSDFPIDNPSLFSKQMLSSLTI